MTGTLSGIEAAYALFASLPEAAREQLSEDLRAIGREARALQDERAPERTGKIKSNLTIEEQIERLRVRIGLPKLGKTRNALFYALIQEYGRQAQEVWVRRLARGNRKIWRQRIRAGEASSRAKPADLATGYVMRVRAMAGRHFVHQEDRVDAIADKYLGRFWDKALART